MRFRISLAAGMALVLFSAASALCSNTVTLANGEWPPYTSKHLPHYGTISQIASEAFALSGIRVNYVFPDSWKRCYVLTRKGTYEATLPIINTRQRHEDFYLSDPLAVHSYVLFHRKDTRFAWTTLDDLQGYRIGVTAAYSYGHPFNRAVAEDRLRVYRAYTDANNFKNILHGRIDAFPIDIRAGYTLIQHLFSPADRQLFTHHPTPLVKLETTLAVSRQIPRERARHLIKAFNSGLMQLKQSGRYTELISNSAP